jgi:hypothetical protein
MQRSGGIGPQILNKTKENIMSKRSIIIIVLIIVSVALMIFEAETTYNNLPGISKWPAAFGAGFVPWVLGFIVAVIRAGYARLRQRAHDFTRSLLWGTGIFTVLMVGTTILRVQESESAIRKDAMLLIPGFAKAGIEMPCSG